ncbi:MAG: carboxypeptidase regulatory-like domain-containing protein [Acidobacteria bacterium]|nr:MAG: carboxypeptidase regulatory-like domain-containing protein [Acidobacteriota bacterium]
MLCPSSRSLDLSLIVVLVALFAMSTLPASAQHSSQGMVSVTVFDPTGASLPGARLELVDVATNDARTATTQENGGYSFVNLPIGTYKLTVSRDGYATQVFETVVVHATQVTDASVTLKVAQVQQTVQVTATNSPLVEATSSEIGTVIDMKQIEDLPLGGRDLQQLTRLVPGYTGNASEGGTWNGLPGGAQGSNIDGVIGQSSRMKDFGTGSAAAVSPRVENIQEMTVQTDQMDLNQGFGQASMQVNYVTRRGTNRFHGRLYDDYQSQALNANDWLSNAFQQPKPKFHNNDFGVSVGGRIVKDKLFFFASYSEFKQPGQMSPTNTVLTPAAQAGNFTYTDTDNVRRTVNVLQIAASNGLNSTIDASIQTELSNINGALQYGKLANTHDANVQKLKWFQPNPISRYYPTVRVDYNLSQTFRLNWAWNETKETLPSSIAALFPGQSSAFKYQIQGSRLNAYTTALGFDWSPNPTLVNEFHGGFLYNYRASSYNAGNSYQKGKNVMWFMPDMNFTTSGDFVVTEISNFYPLFNISDTMTWQHGKHTISFGGSWYREQDHYWNPPIGYPWICLGLAGGDPALNAFTNGPTGTVPNASSFSLGEAEQVYAVLAGRVTCANGNYPVDPQTKQWQRFGAVNLDELQQAWGVFYQDSFRLKPRLTLNYGMRWDFTGDDHDLNGVYHGVLNPADLFGPSGYNNLFHPGSLLGNPNPQYVASSHQYKPWHVSPQPSIGIAWNPDWGKGWLRKLGGDSVIRAGYSLRRFTPAYQDFWSYASNYGAFFYAGFVRNPSTQPGLGNFAPGSLHLEDWQNYDTIAPPVVSPPTYTDTFPESGATFVGPGLAGMNPHISQPYIQSWNLGIQRRLGTNNALEVRYVGNRGVHLWLGININEVNVFENGFLAQFKAAQTNLAINNANGFPNSFTYNNFPGQQPLPIFDAAFAGEGSCGPGAPLCDYGAGNFIQWLQTGQAGAMAAQLAKPFPAPYFCNLVGASFSPCSNPNNGVNYTGAGAGYPINFFQVNPFQSGGGVGYLNSIGYSTYNGLQVQFRQNQWHGMQFNANYTWSHTLGLGNPNGFDGTFPMYTLRNLRLNYGPTQYDMRHNVNVSGTYDLPFGKGKALANRGGVLNKIVGGWTAGTILNFQTGLPQRLQGGFNTFNDIADGGIVLNGVTMSQLQSAVHLSRAHDSSGLLPYMNFLDPKYLASMAGGANTAYILPNTTPGAIGLIPYLYGPHQVFADLSLTKRVPIREDINFTFQTEFLNAFNHTNFGFASNFSGSGLNVQNPGFGTIGPSNGPRAIEMRANIEF